MVGAKRIMEGLPPTQRALFHLLHKFQDVPIGRLYRKLYVEPREPRAQQQAVGAVVSRLNRSLASHGLVVRPGEKRRTYRLYRLPRE